MLPTNSPILDWYINDNVRDAQAHLGLLPTYITSASTDPAWLQIEEHSRSGWNPHLTPKGFGLVHDDYLTFPGLPPLAPAAYAYHLGEKILAYPAGWVVIVQLNGQFSCARVE